VANKQVVILQGGNKREAVYPWMFFHFDPMTDADPGTVDLVYFDYPSEKLKIWKNWDKKRGKPPARSPDSEFDLVPKIEPRRRDGETDPVAKPSVLAFYNYVKSQPKESIRALHVFSHGQYYGPIIWNSWEFAPDGSPIETLYAADRDPNDTDFRSRDFRGKNPLAGAETAKFAQAFATDAFVKLWGCLAIRGVRSIIRSHAKAPKGAAGDAARQQALKNYVRFVGGSYPMQLALAIDRPVWAAPLGYGSEQGTVIPTDYDKDGNVTKSFTVKYKGKWPPNLKEDQWWRVSWFFRNQDRGVEFYRDALKARVDATDFVEHKQAWFEDALRRANLLPADSPVDTPQDLQQRVQDRVDALAP
jgi:hypothetical protein